MRARRSTLVIGLGASGLLVTAGGVGAVDFPMNPRATYLLTNQDPDAAAPLIVDLGAKWPPS